jgi:hypothetical protein
MRAHRRWSGDNRVFAGADRSQQNLSLPERAAAGPGRPEAPTGAERTKYCPQALTASSSIRVTVRSSLMQGA